MEDRFQVPKSILVVLNQLYVMDQKLKEHGDQANLQRCVTKIKDVFSEDGLLMLDLMGGRRRCGLVYEDPMGQLFKETRTDLEASISGSGIENLVVVEVIKPIIRAVLRDSAGEFSQVVQKGVVIVESQKEQ